MSGTTGSGRAGETPVDTAGPGPRRPRAGGRRLDPVLAVAAVVVLVAAGLGLLTRTESPREAADAAPRSEALTRSSLVCPPGDGDVRVATTSGATGPVVARSGSDSAQVDLRPDRAARAPSGEEAVVVRAEGALAPGLVGARTSATGAVAPCTAPAFDQWFTGVGSGAEHRSVLELTNPDGGRAVVDVTVLGRNGVVDVPRLQGLAVAGGATTRLDLAEVVPRREDLTVRVQTTRGRVTAAVEDSLVEVGGTEVGPEPLPSQPGPATDTLLLGSPPGDGERLLTVANPTSDEGRSTLEVVTATSTFAPQDAPEVVIPPRATVQVDVGALLASTPGPGGSPSSDEDAPLGLRLSSTVPVTASVRTRTDDELSTTTSTVATDAPSAVLLPGGRKQLLLGGATSSGSVDVAAWSGRGRALPAESVDVEPGRGSTVDLPGAARLVVLTPDGTQVGSAAVLTTDGQAVVAPRELQLTQPVPQVRPGLP